MGRNCDMLLLEMQLMERDLEELSRLVQAVVSSQQR